MKSNTRFIMDIHNEIHHRYGWLVFIKEHRGGYLCDWNHGSYYQIIIDDELGPARFVDFMAAFERELKEKYPELLL